MTEEDFKRIESIIERHLRMDDIKAKLALLIEGQQRLIERMDRMINSTWVSDGRPQSLTDAKTDAGLHKLD